jgi:hypothetical protein
MGRTDIRISRYSLAAATLTDRRMSLRLREASSPVADGRTDMDVFALREYARTWNLRDRRIEKD